MLLIIPNWDWVRSRIAGKVTEIRAQGFSGAAILSYFELEYGGIVAKMNKLEKIFTVKKRV
jgi:fructose 1,6-bisphosphate aldolase/phosphatase